MTSFLAWRHGAAAFAAALALTLAGCNTPPAYQVTEEPAGRTGTVESIVQDAVQNVNSTAGAIGGALVGGALGSLVGGGTGQTVATIVGAIGGGYAGTQLAERGQTYVWRVGVRYDDGTLATVLQTADPRLRVGDRVRVTNIGIELLGR